MRTHPVFLCLEGRRCVVVGGDRLAASKAFACRDAGAAVTVVAEELTPTLARAADGVSLVQRAYCEGDLAGAVLAYASTRDRELIARLRAEADRERVLLNVLDVPDACGFIAGAVLVRGDLQVVVGTGGASPALAARLRRELAGVVGPEYAPYVAILGAVRDRLAGRPERPDVMTTLLDSPLLDLIRRRAHAEIDGLLGRVVDGRCTLERLGLEAAW